MVRHDPPHPLAHCQSCRFWHAPLSECRRHAPGIHETGIAWPSTRPGDWCGKYEPGHPDDAHRT